MDKNKLKKLYSEALDLSYKNKISITEFVVLPTHEYSDEKNEWVQCSHSVFVGLKKSKELNIEEWKGVERFLENLFGFDCVVNFD